MPDIIRDPRTTEAVKTWRNRQGSRLAIGARSSASLLGALGPSEGVAWLGPVEVHGAGAGLFGITESARILVAVRDACGAFARGDIENMTFGEAWASLSLVNSRGRALINIDRLSRRDFDGCFAMGSARGTAHASRTSTPRPGADSEQILGWQAAERFAAAHMRALGFTDAAVTPPGPDGGIDVRSEAAVAQVKHFLTGAVGRPVVQQIRGAAGSGEQPICYSRSGFTADAIEFAQSTGVALFSYSEFGQITAETVAASALLTGASNPGGPAPADVVQATLIGQSRFNAAMVEYRERSDAVVERISGMRRKSKKLAALQLVTRSINEVSRIVAEIESRDMQLQEILEYCDRIIEQAAELERRVR